MPPRPFKIKRELLPAVGDEDVALLQRNLLATAVDPGLDAKALMPAITSLIRTLINPVETGSGTQKTQSREAAQ